MGERVVGSDVQDRLETVQLGPNTEISLQIDWSQGIGGGLWTTGLQLCQHLTHHRDLYSHIFKGARVLELGSGTGLVGLAAAVLFECSEVVITDLESHTSICAANVTRNRNLFSSHTAVNTAIYDWGKEFDAVALRAPYDIILGTDLAYFSHLHDPLIQALNVMAGPKTLVILGVTKSDTVRDFWSKLSKAGFSYYRISPPSSDVIDTSCFSLFTIFKS